MILTSHAAEEDVLPALKAGAQGYQLKHAAPDEVLSAIRRVHRGESVLPSAVARLLCEELRRPPQRAAPPTDPLSERELPVLKLVAQGMSNQELADALGVSEPTVRTHVSAILRKRQLTSRTPAALYALREGIASLV